MFQSLYSSINIFYVDLLNTFTHKQENIIFHSKNYVQFTPCGRRGKLFKMLRRFKATAWSVMHGNLMKRV